MLVTDWNRSTRVEEEGRGGNYWPDERSFSSTRLGILTERAKLTCFQILRIFSFQNRTKYQIWDKIFDILEIPIVSHPNDWQGCEVSKNWHFYSETAFAVISITILHSPNHHRQTVQRWWKDHFLGGVMFPRPLWNQCVITSDRGPLSSSASKKSPSWSVEPFPESNNHPPPPPTLNQPGLLTKDNALGSL